MPPPVHLSNLEIRELALPMILRFGEADPHCLSASTKPLSIFSAASVKVFSHLDSRSSKRIQHELRFRIHGT
jgi:hypothetical protein